MKAELVDIAAVRPSAYNPRETDPERLTIIELSLRKLGWLLPIYASPDGEIISGHQRHLVAQRMGLARVPAERVKPLSLAERKSVNVVFNRATNDLERSDTTETVTENLQGCELEELAARVEDKQPGTASFYPCLRTREVPVADLIA
ncbi:MAG: ParB N-terminal domain-containing protein, partial [Coriobacteriia bacterium]|nr:ParB N-terminal domain-containing protein [Coriobacteriia bacterium]